MHLDHDHEHEHDHAHPHEHPHTHEHEHDHACGEHIHCGENVNCADCGHAHVSPREELIALMKYMVGHNAAHANELAQLQSSFRIWARTSPMSRSCRLSAILKRAICG